MCSNDINENFSAFHCLIQIVSSTHKEENKKPS